MKKFIGYILVFCLLMSSISGCSTQKNGTLPPSEEGLPSPKVEKREFNKVFDFVLTREDVDAFLECVEETTKNVIDSEDSEYIDEALTAMDDFYLYIEDQKSIADLLYCQDLTDEDLRQQYLTAVDYATEAAEAYNQSAVDIYSAGNAIANEIAFEGWTEQELKRLTMYTEEVTKLEKDNEKLIVQYRDLPDNRFESGVAPIYRDMVDNLNQIARIYEYDNYYAFAYEVAYTRDYAAEKIDTMREYIIQYLAPICDDAYEAFLENYSELDTSQQMLVAELLEGDYEALSQDYIQDYLQTLPKTMREDMQYMFDAERAIFADDENAREGAFTTSVYEEPFCFFGPGYQSAMTVIHELGHFYGLTHGILAEIPLDLAETHSQANEWLFMRYLQDALDQETFETLLSYRLYNDIVMIVACVLVDEFEQRVYSYEDPQSLTRGKLDQIADEVCKAYGGRTYISRYVVDLRSYWKQVAMESPVYYISYAVSALASMDVYMVSLEDTQEALEIYQSLIEEVDLEKGFLSNIEHAGLASPFEKTMYLQLYNMYQ